jgi:hypothetical protein
MESTRESHITETPWEDNNWTKARYFSFIRSALRSATMKYPAKQKYLESMCRKAPVGSRAKKLVNCEECDLVMAKSHAHVDHIIPCGALKNFSDIERFASTLFCGVGNFAVLCKMCNEVYAYADKQKISFSEAKIEKEVIALMKSLSILNQKEYSKQRGYSEADVSNATKRKNCLREIIKKGQGV